MKLKIITVATDSLEGLDKLRASLDRFQHDYIVLGSGERWQGFGTKIKLVYDYAKTLPSQGYTHLLFVDAYDVLFYKGIDFIKEVYQKNFDGKLVFNAEKACYPDYHLADKYEAVSSEWKYLNSGVYLSPIDLFVQTISANHFDFSSDDQRYFTNIFLFHNKNKAIVLDSQCVLFQSVAFEAVDDFRLKNREVYNLKTQSSPALIHANGKTDYQKFYNLLLSNNIPNSTFMNFQEIRNAWANTASAHQDLHEKLFSLVNQDPILNDHRTFVEQNFYGFGERSFQWLWKALVEELPASFSFLEIGVFKGQITSLIALLAKHTGKQASIYGVTMLDGTGGVGEANYAECIQAIHRRYETEMPVLFVGLSTDRATIDLASQTVGELDVLYIDGGHDYETAMSDLTNYVPLVKKGGYVVIDDCANDLAIPFGMFAGIDPVTDALRDYDKIGLEFLLSVVHIKVFQVK